MKFCNSPKSFVDYELDFLNKTLHTGKDNVCATHRQPWLIYAHREGVSCISGHREQDWPPKLLDQPHSQTKNKILERRYHGNRIKTSHSRIFKNCK